MAVGVVAPALVGVAEHAVGLGGLLEALLGLLVSLVAVGMELEGELAVRRLDLLVGGVPGNAQDLVIVSVGGGSHGLDKAEGSARGRAAHGRNMAWPMRLAALSISARRA